MILLWFFFGILLAFGIARYNESNKLFWQLAVSFIIGYATTVMVTRTINGSERSSENLVQVYPTQMLTVAPGSDITYQLTGITATPTKVTALKSAVQVFMPEEHKISTISSKVFGRTRDQPISIITQPPECLTKVIQTLHDTG